MKAIIIDDERHCVNVLAKLITDYCPQVQIVAKTTDSTEGVALVREHQPDILFLDIEMPILNGFQVLDEISDLSFSLVFTTAYDSFAVKAFKYSALDYLLKPIDVKELINAVHKTVEKQAIDNRQLDLLRKQLYAPQRSMSDKIALPYQHGYTFIEIDTIVHCEADNNYTKVHLANNEIHLITKTLGDVEEILEGRSFFRPHRQFLLNLHHIKRIIKNEGTYAVMQNEVNIPIARNKKDEFILLFTKL
jgi:two-component system, LytTR family, response regulator